MSTLERLQKILMAHYPLQKESITPSAKLEQLDIDSLGVMELFFAIEDEFGISVPNDKRSMQTVGDLVDYIDELLSANGSSAVPGKSAVAAQNPQRAVP
ncbi:acyl carrier protein [Oxalobacteraceae bacterium R-40]|uniref:Acyl carrier protein n=1 Tax=Keguizhuia sedimenti TaxID=3064264 RepID=A0ABU1BMG9_9BURK|nr:acyl carrier protein [Oxalobacteraceae bacterium R-40]